MPIVQCEDWKAYSSMTDQTIIDHALRYAGYGWQVIPVMGKRPVGTDWPSRATSDPTKIPELFSCQRDGVGVLLGKRSNLIDFDCDSPVAEAMIEGLFEGVDIETPCYQSTRGKHYLFRWTDNLPQGSIKIVVDGLEIRLGNGSLGCQSVFPPSGGRAWIIDPADCPVAEIPQIVVDRINERYAELKKPRPIHKQPYDSGRINEGFLNVPKWLKKHGREIIGKSEGSDGVTRWHIECPNIALHTTDNSWRDCAVTQSASGVLGGCCFHTSCGMGNWEALKTAVGELEYLDYHEPEDFSAVDISGIVNATPLSEIPTQPEPINPDAMGDIFYAIPGLIGDMIAYHREYAPRPRPELSLVACIALMGVITGRKIQTKSGMRTNIYCIGLAPSGSGKEKPRNNNVLAMAQAGLSRYLGSESPASDAALISELADQPSLLLQIDEIHRYFATLRSEGNQSAHLKNIQKVILELTGAVENPSWSPKSWADKAKKKIISHPHLCLYGTSTADGFWGSVASSDAVDGFLARMMIVEAAREYPRLREREAPATPQSIIDILKAWDEFKAGSGNLSDINPNAVKIHVDTAAQDRIQSHSDGVEDRLTDDPDDRKAIWSRSSALAKRLSLIFAASRGPDGITVTLDDAVSAVRLANWCTRLLIRRVFTHVSSNEFDREKKKVLDIIRLAGQITGYELTRKTQWIRGSRERQAILLELIEAGFVVSDVTITEKAKKPTTVYKILTV